MKAHKQMEYKYRYEFELDYALQGCAEYLAPRLYFHGRKNPLYESVFLEGVELWKIKSSKYAQLAICTAHVAFGDPMELAKQNLRPYHVMYYNPTTHWVNVAQMGLYDDNKKLIEFVEPSSWLSIPEYYTNGGQYSVVNTTAPQLRQVMKAGSHDSLTNITPLTYFEWITYQPNRPSPCCKAQVLWSDTGHIVVCKKCMKAIDFCSKV
jgi:hypothetical protein